MKIESDPLQHLMKYPSNDIDFVGIDRQYWTIIPVVSEKEFDQSIHSTIHVVSNFFLEL